MNNIVVLIFQHIQCLHMMYAEAATIEEIDR